MARPTLKSILVIYLKEQGGWVSKGQLEELIWKNPKTGARYIPDNVGSTLRKLQRSSIIAVKDDKNRKSILYRYIPSYPPTLRKRYIPVSDRPEGKEDVLFREEVRQSTLLSSTEEDINTYMNS